MSLTRSAADAFVAFDLPFTVQAEPRNAHALSYPPGRHSVLLDDVLGGADYIDRHTVHAMRKRTLVAEQRLFSQASDGPSASQLGVQLQPFEISAVPPHVDPRRSQATQLTTAPLFRGEVRPCNDFVLRIVRRKDMPPVVEFLGPVTRTVNFRTPADFVVLDPEIEAGQRSSKIHRAEERETQRTSIPRPASFLSVLTPGLCGYSFTDQATAVANTVRTRSVRHDAVSVPMTVLPEAQRWLDVNLDDKAKEVAINVLEEQPVWVMPELLSTLFTRGLKKPDSNKSIVRSLTYRTLGGPFDRLIVRIGFDVRLPENRLRAAMMQRVVVRAPKFKTRLYRSIAAMPDLPLAVAAARKQLPSGMPMEEFDFLARVFVSDCLLVSACVRDVRAIATIGSFVEHSVLSEYHPASGWYSSETFTRIRMLLRDAISDFADLLIPRLAVAPVGATVAAPVANLTAAAVYDAEELGSRRSRTQGSAEEEEVAFDNSTQSEDSADGDGAQDDWEDDWQVE